MLTISKSRPPSNYYLVYYIFNVAVAGTAVLPPVPNPPLNNKHAVRNISCTCHALLHPSSPPHTEVCKVRFTSGSKLIFASPAYVCTLMLEVWEWGAWQTPWSGQTPNCVKLLCWWLFHFFWVPALVLRSLSLLSDARQRRNLESWLGGFGLVGERVVTVWVQQHHLPTFPW